MPNSGFLYPDEHTPECVRKLAEKEVEMAWEDAKGDVQLARLYAWNAMEAMFGDIGIVKIIFKL